jgi:hypothetical protein
MADLESEFLGFSDPEASDSSNSSNSDAFSDEFDGFSDLEPDRDENTTITPLNPPPTDRTFESFEDCWAFLLAWSLPRGYGIRKGRTKLNKVGGLRKVWIQCDKASKPRTTEATRDSSSKGVSCPFSSEAVLKDGYWQFYVTYSQHSHGPSLHGYTHPCHRKPTEEMLAHITAQSAVGIAPRFILPSLQAMTPGTLISPVDIRNIKNQQKMKELGSMTPVQALISLLERDPDWHHETQLSDDKHLISLFLVRKDMIRFARAYPELLMLDATYKTNWYNMPLVHLIAVIPVANRRKRKTGTALTIGFCFVSGENDASYRWVCERIKAIIYGQGSTPCVIVRDGDDSVKLALTAVFPAAQQLLCLFHVNRNVLEQAKKTWQTDDGLTKEQKKAAIAERAAVQATWNYVVRSHTHSEFTERFEAMCAKYTDQPAFVHYLRTKQEPQKELVVQAWTSLVQHFGNNANSALEGGHKVTKAFLQDSQGDLLTVFKALQLHINSGIQRVIKELADSQNRLSHRVNPKNVSVFDELLIHQVMPFALKKVRDQYDLAKSKDYQLVCSGAFEHVYGLPCCHTIHGLIHVNRKLTVELFHERWRTDRVRKLFEESDVTQPSIPQVLNPHRVKAKGRPRGSESVTQRATQPPTQRATGLPRGSSHRNPSSFELQTGQRPTPPDLVANAERERQAATGRGFQRARERLESGSTPDPTQDVGFTDINDARYADTADLTNLAPPTLPPPPPPTTTTSHHTERSRPTTTTTTTSDEPPAKKPRGRPPKSAEEKRIQAIAKAKAKYKADMAKLGINVDPDE